MTEKPRPLVGIVMGSDTDLPVMTETAQTLKKFGVPFEVEITSAHRSPARTSEYARTAIQRGLKVIIVGAGGASHLAGVIAAETTLPVVGVPMATTTLAGLDALLSTVQMPRASPWRAPPSANRAPSTRPSLRPKSSPPAIRNCRRSSVSTRSSLRFRSPKSRRR